MKKKSLGSGYLMIAPSIFFIFVICFVVYQYKKEREYTFGLIDTRLQNYNSSLHESIPANFKGDSLIRAVEEYCAGHIVENLRVTLIDVSGKVLYDNQVDDFESLPAHSGRPEILLARTKMKGHDIKRGSSILSGKYFYSASYFPSAGYYIRTALPYDADSSPAPASDKWYLWFAAVISLITVFLYYIYVRRLGKNIKALREFADRAKAGEDITSSDFSFPGNDLGEISENIVRLYTQLRDSEDDKTRLKRQLTQNIAHEIKTPVSSLQAYLETMIEDKNMDLPTKERFIERCYAQSKRLSNLLRDVSVLTSMDEAAQPFEVSEVNLYLLLEEVKADLTSQLAEKKMRFLNLTEPSLKIKGNPALIYSIFRNLADNSVAYAGEGASIVVQLIEDAGGGRRFSFSDNGAGVDPLHLPHLFERFYRIDKGRSRKNGGTGLGLAIVKNAVLLHGGDISARLSSTGGIEFIFTLERIR